MRGFFRLYTKWPSPSVITKEARTKDMMSSKGIHQSLDRVVQEQLREVSALLTDIGLRLEVLSSVLWAKDSQESL